MSYFGRNVILNVEQLDYLGRNFEVTQVSDIGSGCLMLLTSNSLSNSNAQKGPRSVVLEDDRISMRLIWADSDTAAYLASRVNQSGDFTYSHGSLETFRIALEAFRKARLRQL